MYSTFSSIAESWTFKVCIILVKNLKVVNSIRESFRYLNCVVDSSHRSILQIYALVCKLFLRRAPSKYICPPNRIMTHGKKCNQTLVSRHENAIESLRLEACNWKQAIESRRLKAGDWKQAIESTRLKAGDWKQAIESRRLEAGHWKQEIESSRLETGDWKPVIESRRLEADDWLPYYYKSKSQNW